MTYPTARIETLCKAVNVGHVGPSSMHRDPDGVPFLMGKNVGFGSVSTDNLERVTEGFHRSQPKSQLRTGDVIVVRIGKSGQAAKVPDTLGEANCSGLVIIKQPLKVDTDFLVYYLNSPIGRSYSISQARGSTRLTLNTKSIAATPVPVPPLPEQRRIVGILDEAFEGIATAKANAEKNLQNARAIFESHLQSVFTQRGDGWAARRLGDVVVRLTNGYVGPTRGIYLQSGVPYLLARHVKNNRLTFDDKTFISNEFNRKNKKSMLKAGDVLLVQSGHIGHSAVVTEDHEGHNCHAMIVITPVEDAVTGPFLSLYFNSSGMRQKFEEIRSGSTVPHLTCRAVRELSVRLPQLAAQRRLVEHSRELEAETQRLESIYRRKLAALDELKKSLLHQAFSGDL